MEADSHEAHPFDLTNRHKISAYLLTYFPTYLLMYLLTYILTYFLTYLLIQVQLGDVFAMMKSESVCEGAKKTPTPL